MPSGICYKGCEAVRNSKYTGLLLHQPQPHEITLPRNAKMNFDHVAKDSYLSESGEEEAANRVLVTQRLKRSGQYWGRDGGQEVLAYRALLKSDRVDRAWRMVVPKIMTIIKAPGLVQYYIK